MFGIKNRDREARHNRLICQAFNRSRHSFRPLDSLVAAIKPHQSVAEVQSTAIVLDTNVLLKIGTHPQSTDIIDYLGAQHRSALILPGQVIQEFWNNQFTAVDSVSSGLKKKFDAFKLELVSVDPVFAEYSTKIDESLNDFNSAHGDIFAEGTVNRTVNLLEVFQRKGIVSHAPRDVFDTYAVARKRTKTPPGFKDEGDGDFYVWVDMLKGLLIAREQNLKFNCVALITQDAKKDWSRAGRAHPILDAEVRSIVGVPFETWTIDNLAKKISVL